MDFKDFNTGKNDEGRRLDKVIRIFLSEINLSQIYKLIRKGLVKVNHKKTTADYKIESGDVISIAGFLLKQTDKQPVVSNITEVSQSKYFPEIIFENEHILIINKPYDVNVHGDNCSLDKQIFELYEKKYRQNDLSLSFKPGPLHRLDKKTTGLLAFSLSLEGAKWFTQNINEHTIQKKYYAILVGKIKEKENWIDFILNQSETENGFCKVEAKTIKLNEDYKQAISFVTPLSYGKYHNVTVTLASIEIKTGRKHQIRSQAALHNHVLLGDTAYGASEIHEKRNFYLCAYELCFPENPVGLPDKISIPLPDDFKSILKDCGIKKTGL